MCLDLLHRLWVLHIFYFSSAEKFGFQTQFSEWSTVLIITLVHYMPQCVGWIFGAFANQEAHKHRLFMIMIAMWRCMTPMCTSFVCNTLYIYTRLCAACNVHYLCGSPHARTCMHFVKQAVLDFDDVATYSPATPECKHQHCTLLCGDHTGDSRRWRDAGADGGLRNPLSWSWLVSSSPWILDPRRRLGIHSCVALLRS